MLQIQHSLSNQTRVESFWTFCRKSLWPGSYSKYCGPNRQNLKYFRIWWKFKDLSMNFWKNNCPYKKLSFFSQLLKNTKIHLNLPILVLKVSLCVIEPEKWNFGGCLWWNSEVFRQNVLRGRSKNESKNWFRAKSKNVFHKSCV
jgi:hypothetical protein